MKIDNELLDKYNSWKCDCGGFPECICKTDKKVKLLTYNEAIKFAKDMCELQKIECSYDVYEIIDKESVRNCKNICDNES